MAFGGGLTLSGNQPEWMQSIPKPDQQLLTKPANKEVYLELRKIYIRLYYAAFHETMTVSKIKLNTHEATQQLERAYKIHFSEPFPGRLADAMQTGATARIDPSFIDKDMMMWYTSVYQKWFRLLRFDSQNEITDKSLLSELNTLVESTSELRLAGGVVPLDDFLTGLTLTTMTRQNVVAVADKIFAEKAEEAKRAATAGVDTPAVSSAAVGEPDHATTAVSDSTPDAATPHESGSITTPAVSDSTLDAAAVAGATLPTSSPPETEEQKMDRFVDSYTARSDLSPRVLQEVYTFEYRDKDGKLVVGNEYDPRVDITKPEVIERYRKMKAKGPGSDGYIPDMVTNITFFIKRLYQIERRDQRRNPQLIKVTAVSPYQSHAQQTVTDRYPWVPSLDEGTRMYETSTPWYVPQPMSGRDAKLWDASEPIRAFLKAHDPGTSQDPVAEKALGFILDPPPTDGWGDDIVGMERLKAALEENIIGPQKHPELYDGRYVKASRNVLLYGPPGTGKTMIAQRVAAMTGALFAGVSADRLFGGYQSTAANIVSLLYAALELSGRPAVVFFDEAEQMVGNRENTTEETYKMLVQAILLWTEENQIKAPIYTIFATNVPQDIDPAVKSRVGTTMAVWLPSESERRDYLKREFDGAVARGISTPQIIEPEFIDKMARLTKYRSFRTLVSALRAAWRTSTNAALHAALASGSSKPISKDQLMKVSPQAIQAALAKSPSNESDCESIIAWAKETKTDLNTFLPQEYKF